MNAEEILITLIENMSIQQKNMDFLANGVDKKIIEIVNDQSLRGQLDKKMNIQHLLEHDSYCAAKRNTFAEVEEWARETLKKIKED